jgi:hypothetical protein
MYCRTTVSGAPPHEAAEVGRRPEVPVHDRPVHAAGEIPAQDAGGHALEAVHEVGHGDLRRVVHQQVHVAASHTVSMSSLNTPRRYLVTKTK